MGLFNKILGEAMIYTESVGMTKKLTYEEALEVLLNPNANPIELAKAENTMAMARKTTGSDAKGTIGIALCKSRGLLTDATTREAQMHEAANFLSASAVEASAEDDHSSFDVLKKVMESKRNVFPVLDENGGISGIVTLDDVRPFLLDSNLYDVVLVYDIMKTAGPSLDVHDSLGAATRLFESTRLWLIPVLENGKYIGFVSKAGVFDKYRDMLRNQRDLF